ncbi:MAG: prepilin peptidase [Candidatus Omnitrophota bacterium]
MEYFIVFVFGAVSGSFLNVCVYRLPKGKSIVRPRSFCPSCETPVKWYDNIPLISFLVLRGKCRACSKPISFRYFLIELLTALASVFFFYHYSVGVSFFCYWLFLCMLIVVTFIDFEYQEIPDVISLPGILVGLALMTVFRLDGSQRYLGSFLNSFIGIIAGGGSMFLLGMFGELIFKKEALGGGDVKLMAMIGAFIGWKLVWLTFFIAPVLGAGVGIVLKLRFKQDVIAYGPYLSLAAIISLLWGREILGYFFW